MSDPVYTREMLTDGSAQLVSTDCSFVFTRPRPGVLLVMIVGHDHGQFGTSALDEIMSVLNRERPLELFVDTSDAVGVAVSVRQDWTRFFSSNRANLSAVHVLTRSKIVHVAIAVAQLFSATGGLIRLYSRPDSFQGRLDHARGRPIGGALQP